MNLVAAMRSEYGRSETLLWSSFSVKVLIYLTTVATAAWSNGLAASVLLVLASVGQIFLFTSRLSMQGHLNLGERLRRLAMLQDGIGREPTPFELAALPERVWDAKGTADQRSYYSSQLPKGSKRLVDVTAECAFFSGKIAHTAWTLFLVVSIVASGILFLSLVLIAILGAPQSRLEVVAKCVLIGITFWMTEDLIDMALRYRDLTSACERVLQECFRLLGEGSPSSESAYVVLHEYDAAVAAAPPLSSRMYRQRNEGLTKIWAEARSRCTTNEAA